jgi:hypothetical protein
MVKEFLNSWHLPAEDYQRRREALDKRQYSYFGNCPECEAEGALFPTPDKSDVMVCSAGCKVAWVVESGLFSMRPEGHGLSAEEAERSYERLVSEYREVEPLTGWKLDLLSNLDVGIRMLEDVQDCSVCGFSAVPEDLRKLSRFIHWSMPWPLLALNPQAPLCMVCGQEFDHELQDAVNGMWWLNHPIGIGKMVSAPHADDF